jgi:pimeloyl-ACP methyl ester carboxylesterase
VIRQFSRLDFERYFKMMLRLNEHTAEPYLSQIAVPVLITAGSRDIMTPVESAELMARRIRDAELLVVPNGTHYTLLEYPDIVNLALERFLRRVYPEDLPAAL